MSLFVDWISVGPFADAINKRQPRITAIPFNASRINIYNQTYLQPRPGVLPRLQPSTSSRPPMVPRILTRFHRHVPVRTPRSLLGGVLLPREPGRIEGLEDLFGWGHVWGDE